MKESNKDKQVEKPNPNEPIFASSSQGLLRTKIEAGKYYTAYVYYHIHVFVIFTMLW